MDKKNTAAGPQGPIYDARELGTSKMLILGLQHMFAMFGATVLVPILTGIPVSSALFFAGVGTLLFHLITGGIVPAFLGSSFAFIGGYTAITNNGANLELLPYACFGVFCAGLMYVVLASLFKIFGIKKIMKYFPPIVTGPIIICIGLILSSSAITNCQSNWPIALVAIVTVVIANIWGKGMIKIIPILLGVIASYAVAAVTGNADFSAVKDAAWIGLPVAYKDTMFSIFTDGNLDTGMLITALFTIVPISLATMVEHIGDICAISSTCERNYIQNPGLHRTLLGDGLATSLAAMFGAPANTTYGENTGVLALSKVYDPRVIRLAAIFAIIFSFSPKFAALISAMPDATIGGISLILYGMISAVGVRNVVENQVDFTNSRNVLIAAIILVLAIGINYSIGSVTIGAVSLSGLAVASLVGILLNAVLPGKDYEFEPEDQGSTSVNFKV